MSRTLLTGWYGLQCPARCGPGTPSGRAEELGVEYGPRPPCDAGSPHRAPAEVVDRLRSVSRLIRGAEPST
ncbi:hypothetical protein [Streptomyces sp. NPDC086519]|uniref:hypothetical protein n=1 Tax=Streptomyces sp. NPDC086519 TaxID=3154863 RepID=UPI0034473E1A